MPGNGAYCASKGGLIRYLRKPARRAARQRRARLHRQPGLPAHRADGRQSLRDAGADGARGGGRRHPARRWRQGREQLVLPRRIGWLSRALDLLPDAWHDALLLRQPRKPRAGEPGATAIPGLRASTARSRPPAAAEPPLPRAALTARRPSFFPESCSCRPVSAPVPTHQQIALIGAGPSGLAGARNLQKLGIPFQGFEAYGDVGGLWNIGNPRSTVYQSAHLISSKRTTEFAEFPMAGRGGGLPEPYRTAPLLQRFRRPLRSAPALPLRHRGAARRAGGRRRLARLWRVSVDAGDGRIETADYKGVVIANGTLSEPSMPRFDGTSTANCCTPRPTRAPSCSRTSGCWWWAPATAAATSRWMRCTTRKSVDISVRRGYYFVPKYIFGKPADTLGGKRPLPAWIKQRVDAKVLQLFTGDPVRFGFPKPDYRMYESHPVVNSLVLHHIGHGDIGVSRRHRAARGRHGALQGRQRARLRPGRCAPPATSCTTPSSTAPGSTGRAWRRSCT